jgi:hypothetical protein
VLSPLPVTISGLYAARTALRLGRHPRTLAQAGGFASVGVRCVGDGPAALHSVVAEAPNFATNRT